LAKAGWRVVLADRNEELVQLSSKRLRDLGLDAEPAVLDVTDSDSVSAVVRRVALGHGLNSLVNAAGVLQLGTILDVKETDWDRVLSVNLKGAYLTCRETIQAMAGSGGTIVNIASQSGRTSSFYSAPNYVASKAGLIGLTMALAAQHAAQGIRVNCVAPGLVDTPMIADAYSAEQRARMTAATPLGRFASAAEVGEVVLFLASEQSSYMTGQTLNVNGGSFMS
jgi:NAD(P)-dependent dehydrogenase (short-subunit alcohol dehydrogenase family)